MANSTDFGARLQSYLGLCEVEADDCLGIFEINWETNEIFYGNSDGAETMRFDGNEIDKIFRVKDSSGEGVYIYQGQAREAGLFDLSAIGEDSREYLPESWNDLVSFEEPRGFTVFGLWHGKDATVEYVDISVVGAEANG